MVLIAALAGAGMLGALSPRLASAGVEALVTNYLGDSVTTYARTASGNVAPLRVIGGSLAGLQNPAGLAVDTVNKEIFVANISSITVYSLTACGNAAPLRTITDPIGLAQPIGLAVDAVNDEVFVANVGSITVYGRTDDGTVGARRTIKGLSTGLTNPFGLALDTVNNEVLVANVGDAAAVPPGPDAIIVHSRTADGNVPPIRTISGAATRLDHPIGLAVDTVHNEVVVANESSIAVYERTANGNVAPRRVIEGASTGLDHPLGLGLDTANGEIFVANLNSEAVTVYDRTAGGPPGSTAANVAPRRVIAGAATLLTGPAFPIVAAVPAEFNFDFSGVTQGAFGEQKATCFRDVHRGNQITAGLDLGSRRHTALNIVVSAGDAQNTWLTVYDSFPASPAPGPLFDAPQTVCADVLVVPFNNSKGAGVVTMLNEGKDKEGKDRKGLALILYEAGNTDTLRLATLNGNPDKKGQLTTLKSAPLQAGISGNTWYRLIMTVRLSPTPEVTGQVFSHSDPANPNSPLGKQVGGTLRFSQATPIAGVTSPGESGIVASSISAVLNASVTNFTNDAARCTR